MRSELTFDGFGINGPDEYRTRLATFPHSLDEKMLKRYGPMFAASPEVLAALEDLMEGLRELGCYPDSEDSVSGADVVEHLHVHFPELLRVIAKARGEGS